MLHFEQRADGGFTATYNATADQTAWEPHWPPVELLWGYMILLHFARLLPIDPLVLHFLSVVWKFMPNTATPVVTEGYQAIGGSAFW